MNIQSHWSIKNVCRFIGKRAGKAVITAGILFSLVAVLAAAQSPPTAGDVMKYEGLHAAAHVGNVERIKELIEQGVDLEEQDEFGRTAVHIAAFGSQKEATKILVENGADINALEKQAYDAVTIAAVANDIDLVDLLLSLGASASNITSPYDGTALIAAAHLGHHEVVKSLITAGAPLDHINNLGWTALIEAVILGDGGPDHIETVRALVTAGADKSIPDREGITPLQHAIKADYSEIATILGPE